MNESATAPALLALDWGTSSLRACLVDSQGQVLANRRADHGIQHLPAAATRQDGFRAAFTQIAFDWLSHWPGLPVAASGMVGSAQGWQEAPYARTPAGLAEVAARAIALDAPGGARLHVAPGILHEPAGAAPDVMRGEEIQIFGALAAQPALADGACFVLPGTHSKWVRVEGGRIVGFSSYMTGELFALLKAHSTLGALIDEHAGIDPEGFPLGLRAAAESQAADLPHQLFAVRTLGLTGRLPRAALGEYLSGLLIGHEVFPALRAHADLLGAGAPLVLIGEEALCARYAHVLAPHVASAPRLLANTAPRGLLAFARAAALL
ncbi:MAG: 2-dehydro-3-deoxygalactonokinase [Candidatus Dactylopiibacterium sp.]|nr:2-dehydro-3-deoxygalactonokinase [Candidatus Dactylopiibacterium sp.]